MANPEEQGLEYWLRWQVPVCALIFLAPTVIALILLSRLQRAPLPAYDLWLPCWKRLNPIWLLMYRAVVFVFMSWLLSQIVAVHGAFSFYFYTQIEAIITAMPYNVYLRLSDITWNNKSAYLTFSGSYCQLRQVRRWTFALVIVYFALGTIVSAHGCWTFSKKPEYEEGDHLLKKGLEDCSKSTTTISFRTNKIKGTMKLQSHQRLDETEEMAGFWGYLMQTIYQTCAGAVILTDIVFWCILVPFLTSENFRVDLLMGCMHSLNVVFLLLDTALNRLQFPWFRLVYFVLWSCLYIIFQWVLHACGFTWWPYPFLELSTPWAPLWYFSLAVIHIPCYGIYALIAKAKNAVFSRLFPDAYISHRTGSAGNQKRD